MYRLKKSLGQHFLKDEKVVQKIIDTLLAHPFNNLLEVGPGGGALTKELIKIKDINFKAVELDEEKVNYLLETFPELEGKLIHEDFLKSQAPFHGDFSIIGNFPYNISSQILFKIVEWHQRVPLIIGMFQDEVARRAAASPGSKTYGVLSVLIQYYYDIQYLFKVSNQCFSPPPKVQSAVIQLTSKKELLPVKDEKTLKLIVKTAFGQRRKTLRNALKSIIPAEKLKDPLFDRRAETLSLKEFADLTFLDRS